MSALRISRRFFVAGIAALTLLAPVRMQAQSLVPLYYFWNPSNLDHLFTIDYGEGSGWSYQGIACYVYASSVTGTIPVYRYFNASSDHHFLTSDFGELGYGAGGFTYEGIAFHVFDSQVVGSVPLHRWYFPISGKHYYTTSSSPVGGAQYEGFLGYVSPS